MCKVKQRSLCSKLRRDEPSLLSETMSVFKMQINKSKVSLEKKMLSSILQFRICKLSTFFSMSKIKNILIFNILERHTTHTCVVTDQFTCRWLLPNVVVAYFHSCIALEFASLQASSNLCKVAYIACRCEKPQVIKFSHTLLSAW